MSAEKEGPVRGPVEWLLRISLSLLFTVIALRLALCLLAQIWPWVLGIGLVLGSIWTVIAVRADRRKRW